MDDHRPKQDLKLHLEAVNKEHHLQELRIIIFCLSRCLSFVDRMQIDKLEYKKLSNEFWSNNLLEYKGKEHKKVPIKYLDGFWNNIGATDSISLLYMRNYKLITNVTLSKLFRFSISKLILHWASLFKIGARGISIEEIDQFLDEYYKQAEYNERTYNNINWDEYD